MKAGQELQKLDIKKKFRRFEKLFRNNIFQFHYMNTRAYENTQE